MDDTQQSFACRMVRRRDVLRNSDDSDGALSTSTNQDSLRRYNILKAINEPYFHLEPYEGMDDHANEIYNYRPTNCDGTKNVCNNNNNDESIDSYNKVEKAGEKSIGPWTTGMVASFVKSFESGRKKWHGPPASNYPDKSSSSIYKRPDDYSDGYSASMNETSAEESPKLLKVTEGNIKMPSKMIATLTNLGNTSDEFIDEKFVDPSQLSTLSAEIDDLDAQIEALELETANAIKTQAFIEPPPRIYPVIEDVKFEPTGWTLQKDRNSRAKPCENGETADFTNNKEKNQDSDFSKKDINTGTSRTFVQDNVDEITPYHETPKKSTRKMPLMESTRKMPLMESTRKSPHSDSTKIKFPTPTRIESTISTLSPNSPEYVDRKEEKLKGNEEILDMTVTFEEERFLQDALGDELYNTSVTFDVSEARDKSHSKFTASDLISRERTPLRRKIMHTVHPPATEPPRGNSNTLNRSMGLYRSLSHRIRKKFRSALKSKQESPSPPKSSNVNHGADIIGQLLQEVSIQQNLMNQASKALNVCHTMKEFVESSERVESDRLLLVASLRRTAALEEIKRVSSQENKDDEFVGEKGEITIKDIRLNLREGLKIEPEEGETVEWFVVVVSQGLKVWATQAIRCPINKLSVDFPEIVAIPNMTPDFKILVQVFSLKLRNATYNHEVKYRIRKLKRSTSCPPFSAVSPMKLLKKSERPVSPKPNRNNASKTGCTCFVLSGFVELFLHDLSLTSPWPLMLVPENSILDRTIDLDFACRLHLSVSHEGFLNHGDEAGGLASWNRRWCVLKGHTLMLWNYPRDQETKEPLTIIELINCVSTKITTAHRTICAKPRTLLIETVRRKNVTDRDSMVFQCRTSCTIVRNFLSYDTVPDLMEWSTKLNHVILALREWNVIGTAPPQISDL